MGSNEEMKELVTVINKLQDAFASTYSGVNLELPKIAVIGGQSAGKSSVLESVAGRDFLPKGAGIVTRCPINLQMIPDEEEYVELLEHPDVRYTDFNDVKKVIADVTDKETADKAVSSKPIMLRFYSPHVLQLTLVDLPGLTKIPVGNQPEDIEQLVHDMILEYIKPSNTLILAVTPATEDLANSDALKLARRVDPEGERTIGVLTKLDLMDKGTDARRVLENKIYPLKRGYIGVVNRSQKDVEEKVDLREARDAEEKFFLEHAVYRHMTDRVGTKTLQRVLNRQLQEHIREKLPGIRSEMIKQKADLQQKLQSMDALEDKDINDNALLHQVMARFTKTMEACFEGFDYSVDTKEIVLGVVINETINTNIINGLLNERSLMLTKEEVMTALRNLVGVQNYISASQQVFKNMVEKITKKFKEPMKKSVEIIAALTQKAIEKCARKEIISYPHLEEAVLRLLMERLQDNELKCKEDLERYIKAECAFMNTNHPWMGRCDSDGHSHKRCLSPSDYDEGKAKNPTTLTNSTNPSKSANPTNPVELKPLLPPKPKKVLHQGYLDLASDSQFFKKKKPVWITITPLHVSIYTDHGEGTELMQLQNTKIKIGVETDVARRRKKFIISRIDGSFMTMVQARIIETMYNGTKGNEEGERWENTFKEAGIQMEDLGNPVDGLVYEDEGTEPHPTPRKCATPPPKIDFSKDAHDHMERILKYVQIVKQTIQDLTPKYIVHTIIKELMTYVNERLVAEIQEQSDLKKLMEPGGEEELKKRKMRSMFDATTEAVGIINSLAWLNVDAVGEPSFIFPA
ncbi:unnamed protein product [Darwinula stevensoni]|uniref:dynamin GTPase n=1 Tax=Darwinula stevensoni TaxID=69355 RepID=A0A7R8WXL4_9CRUS|nr:unnamed protein product [Darwinula stevensoni]CAG0878523.1 unnamed protein product [Darwinula stevensoni]